jgi:signal transduction histidine kinase
VEIVIYNLVTRGMRRQAGIASVFVVAYYAVEVYNRDVLGILGKQIFSLFSLITLLGIAWSLGEFMRARRAYFDEVERRAQLAESERQALARAAVAEERNRIARELHDVLAHSVSVMVVNAEGAVLMRHSDPAVVDRTLKMISSTGRGALVELRRVLEVLPDGRSPQPTVAELESLVSKAAAGRAPIGLAVSGDDTTLPTGAALQTYRIVQEALTNVVKHAPPDTPARVRVDLGASGPDRQVCIEVTNEGAVAGAPATLPGSGHGIAGMRQRVALYNGTFEAGPTSGGGFKVAATLNVVNAA